MKACHHIKAYIADAAKGCFIYLQLLVKSHQNEKELLFFSSLFVVLYR